MNNNSIFIPKGRLADDDAIAKAKREALRRKLMSGERIPLKNNGSATDESGSASSINIPSGKLADDDAIAKAKREALRQKLMHGGRIVLKNNGSVTDENGANSSINIPSGKLAVEQWYEKDPGLLEMEKIAMKRAFPNFELEKLDDGRLAWVGKLNIGVYESKFHEPMEYHVMALYQYNHPNQQMGSSVRIYPVFPDVSELITKCGFRPYHLLRDNNDELYLCTNEAKDVKVGQDVTSAASVLGWACKWFLSYELVLTGDLDKEEFNKHGGI